MLGSPKARRPSRREPHAPIHGDRSKERINAMVIPEDLQAIVAIDKNGIANIVPILSKGTDTLVFQSDTRIHSEAKQKLEKELTDKIGIKCVVVNGGIGLVAIKNG